MRKIFTLFAAMLFAVVANAKVWNVPISVNDALRDSIVAATPGDTMLLSTGKYLSPEQIHLNKSITIMAANGASPVVPIRWYSDLTGENTKVNIIGVKFVGNDSIYTEKGNPVGAADHCIYPQDTLPGKELHLENCEFVGFPSHVLYNNGKNSLDSLVVNNCYFHNNDNSSIIYFDYYRKADDNQSVKAAKITNSTFANNGAKTAKYSVVYIFNKTQSAVSDVKIVLDHCTFYNNPTENTDHSSIRSYKSTNVAVSNCIFAHPSAYGRRATCLYGGTISNCLTYNLTYDSDKNGHRTEGGKPTLSNNFTADPLFVDVTEGFQVKGDWKKGEISPARGAGTDGSDLGDPRWYTAEVLPNVDFDDPYLLAPAKAQLSGSTIALLNDSLKWTENVDGKATWKINATKACYVSATVKEGTGSGHRYKLVVLDEKGNVVGDTIGEAADTWKSGELTLGTLLIPAGIHTIKLLNLTAHSASRIDGVTLTYLDEYRTLYLNPGLWNTNPGTPVKFAIWCFTNSRSLSDTWSDFMTVDEGDIYKATILASYTQVIFARINGALDEPDWGEGKCYTQSATQTLVANKDLYVITDWEAGYWDKRHKTFEDGWYLVGEFSDVEKWTINELTADRKFTSNVGHEHEFMLTTSLAEGDEFKAVYVYCDAFEGDLKPAGANYVVDADHAGNLKTIYFNEAGAGGDDWFAHTFYIEKNSATSLDNVLDTEKTVKAIENGQLVIIKNGVRYNVIGSVIR